MGRKCFAACDPRAKRGRLRIMNIDYYISRLETNARVFEQLISGIGPEQGSWKPAADKWSILEVINHLYDEEREDFRARLKNTLDDPSKEWDPISPVEWVTERKYSERDLNQSFQNFVTERADSIEWLRSVSGPKWSNSYSHSSGAISAGDLICSWAAHDLIHIKQITRLHYDYLTRLSAPYSPDYAGGWK